MIPFKHLLLNVRIVPGLLLIVFVIVVGGCATPVGVRYLDPKQIQRNLTASILSSDELSASTRQILNRSNLTREFRSQPEEVLASLHKGLPTASDVGRLFALAELSYAYASEGGPKSYYLASAIYAYAFLFPEGGRPDLNRSDPRVRIALDLYNRSLAEALTTADRTKVVLDERNFPLPFGELTVVINREEFRWGSFQLVDFVQAAELDVRGLRNRYRWPGFSIETRKEKGEGYSAIKGFFKQYELIYIAGDESDLMRVRTDYRNPQEDVYLYRTKVNQEKTRKLFMEYVRQINAMKEKPIWYHQYQEKTPEKTSGMSEDQSTRTQRYLECRL